MSITDSSPFGGDRGGFKTKDARQKTKEYRKQTIKQNPNSKPQILILILKSN